MGKPGASSEHILWLQQESITLNIFCTFFLHLMCISIVYVACWVLQDIERRMRLRCTAAVDHPAPVHDKQRDPRFACGVNVARG